MHVARLYVLSWCHKVLCCTVRSSKAETVEQNSDSEGSESSEETSDLWTLFKNVRTFTTNLGLCLSEPFLRLPSKRFVYAVCLCVEVLLQNVQYTANVYYYYYYY